MGENRGMSVLTKILALITTLLMVIYFIFPDITIILPILLIVLSLLILMFGTEQIKSGGKISGIIAIIGSVISIALIVIKVVL